MNICFITYRENNPYIGGIENVTYLLCKSFIERGHCVVCISQINSKNTFYRPVCKEFFFPITDNLSNKTNLLFLETVIEEHGIDIIINQNSVDTQSMELCDNIKRKITRIKIITPLHFDLFYEEKAIANNFFIKTKNGNKISAYAKDMLFFFQYHLYKKKQIREKNKRELEYIYKVSDYVVFLSHGAKEEADRLIGQNIDKNSIVIGNPIEICDDCYYSKSKEILYVGRIEFGLKRFDRMLHIWKQLENKNPDWKLIVIGDGEYRGLFENKAKELGIERIYFKGFKDPAKYYRTASIVCLTSSSEGFAKVLAEAQSNACVPVAFNSFVAINDIISNGSNGFCIKAFNIHLFAKQLQKLMNDKDAIKTIGEQARKDSLQFSVERITDKWENLFKSFRCTQ